MTVRYLRLSDVCDINPRLSRTHDLADDDEVSFVPMAAVDEVSGAIRSAEVRRFAEVKKGYTFFADGDVLFAKITPCMENGKAALAGGLAGGRGFGSTEFHVLRAGGQVMPEWLRYFVRREPFRRDAKRNFTGTAGQQRVPTSFLQNALIPVPSRAEQQRIVDLLSRAEGIGRLRRQAQQKAAELIPAIFVDMFGDPATNPKGWPQTMLGELIANGPTNGLYKHKSAYGSGTPILRIDAFYDGRVTDLTALKRVQVEPDEQRRFALLAGDIIVNRVNSPEYLGKSALVPELLEPTVFESNMMRFSIDALHALPEFVIALLQAPSSRRHFLSNAKHAINQSSINQQDVKSLPVFVPPLQLQRQFTQRVAAVRAIEQQQQAATSKAEATFSALLARAFAMEVPQEQREVERALA